MWHKKFTNKHGEVHIAIMRSVKTLSQTNDDVLA